MIDAYLQQCMDAIKGVPDYPFDESKDAVMLAERIAEFPAIDILSLIRRWKARIYDFPFSTPCKKRLTSGRCSCRPSCKSSPRSQFYTQCVKAMEYGWCKRSASVAMTEEIPSVKEQIRRQNERAAKRKAELGIA